MKKKRLFIIEFVFQNIFEIYFFIKEKLSALSL